MTLYELKHEIHLLRMQVWNLDEPKKRKRWNKWVTSHIGKTIPQANFYELQILRKLIQDKISGKQCTIHQGQETREKRRRRLGGKLNRPYIIKILGNTCAKCGKKDLKPKDELTIDHIIPLFKGGTSELSNLQILCRPCHNEKTFGIEMQEAKAIHNQRLPEQIKKALSIKI